MAALFFLGVLLRALLFFRVFFGLGKNVEFPSAAVQVDLIKAEPGRGPGANSKTSATSRSSGARTADEREGLSAGVAVMAGPSN